MSRKRPVDAAIRPEPEVKRVKREEGVDHFDMSSIPAGTCAASAPSTAVIPKTESDGDYKPLGPVRLPPVML